MDLSELKHCESCNKRIPFKNFEIHKVNCARNTSASNGAHSGQAVTVNKQKVRFDKFRAAIKITRDDKKVRSADQGNHRPNKSTKQLATCRFCEVMLPGVIVSEHEEYCGSKTDICKKCEYYVMVKEFAQHLEDSEDENPPLPCEFCENLFPANELVIHQNKCVNNERRENRTSLKENIDGATKTERDKKHDSESRRDKEKMNEERRESAELSREKKIRERPNSHRESISIVALPCEVCGELCPSDKLMQHQIQCQKERERVSQRNPKTAQHTSPRPNQSATSRYVSSQNGGTRYIEVQRGYSPTIEFEDDSESLEDKIDISADYTLRGEQSPNNFSPPRPETIHTSGDVDVSGVRYIEIQRSYSPTIEFEEETVPEIFSHNMSAFFRVRDP